MNDSATPAAIRPAPPLEGRQTSETLARVPGRTPEQIEERRKAGSV